MVTPFTQFYTILTGAFFIVSRRALKEKKEYEERKIKNSGCLGVLRPDANIQADPNCLVLPLSLFLHCRQVIILLFTA